jgi:hypothetical protein
VCPANEDVREYFAVLCDDIVDQFDISLIRLEGIITRTYDFDWLRPRVIVNVPPVARELLAVCFCASCTTRAAAEGLDVHRLSGLVNGAIAAELGDGTDSTDAETAANAAADPELRAFLVQQVRSSTDFVRAAVSRIDVGRIPRTSTTASTPFPALLGAVEEGLLEELVDVIDQVAMFPGNVERLRPGSSTPTPVAHAGADLAAPELQEAAELGVAELGLYNYGLLRERDVREFVAAVRTAFP